MKKNVNKKSSWNTPKTMIKIGITLWIILCIVWVAFAFVNYFKESRDSFKHNVVDIVSTEIGTEMQKDEYGNVNALLLWYGWDNHDGGYLTDSIIIASRNPEWETISLFSIPRDLRVKYPYGWNGKINGAFYQVFTRNGRDLSEAWSGITKYFEDITNMKIPYYAMIDFTSFQGIVDAIWWIDIEVPETIHDSSYPGPNRSYITFHIDAWFQHLDGATALKYARSRHSTSDFSRSLRQQKILFGIKDKIVGSGLNLDTVEKLYEQYQTYVKTNVNLQEMLWMVKYVNSLNNINSYGFTTTCGYANHERMVPACFLYTPARDAFGGLSVILPDGATANNISYYKHIQNFIDFIISNPLFGKEKAKVWIKNGIDSTLLAKKKLKNVKIAWNLAVKMKRYWFTIGEIDNADTTWDVSYIRINKEGSWAWTIKAIQKIFPIEVVYPYVPPLTGNILTGLDEEHYEEIENQDQDDITIVLGADYVIWTPIFSWIAEKKFSYEL